ncbi:Rv3654c family TadE-like protein [Streptomyces leeuwenhoekii]|uniref:Rv3654c family TadE-like protein n=1 Tax=Streptomyces leeuwenhoekii TaxID=1437453 RepID=UPI00099D3582|nr:Rv3654c family TadE-like protein [Streptomyces leeuwenhoekii]
MQAARAVAARRLGRSDRGSATVWSLAVLSALCVVFGVVLALGQAVVARHRAAGGADLAALAAADHWARGEAAACARAERVARAHSVRLVRCAVTGQVSDVTAASGRGPFAAEVRARAGPADSVPEGRERSTGPVRAVPEGRERSTGPVRAVPAGRERSTGPAVTAPEGPDRGL